MIIGPDRYNALFLKIGNLNRLLAWGHARVIENLCALRPECPRALSDKFADVRVLQRALMEKGRSIILDQQNKGRIGLRCRALLPFLPARNSLTGSNAAGKTTGSRPAPRRLGPCEGGCQENRWKPADAMRWPAWPKCTSRLPPKCLGTA